MKFKAEDLLSMKVADQMRYRLPPDAWATCIGHGSRHPAMARKLQKLGVVGGVPDWIVIWRGIAVFIELKVEGYPSPQQKVCHAALRVAGVTVFVARNVEQFLGFLTLAGVPLLLDVRPEGEFNDALPF